MTELAPKQEPKLTRRGFLKWLAEKGLTAVEQGVIASLLPASLLKEGARPKQAIPETAIFRFDLDGDGRVGFQDLVKIATSYDKENPEADVNGVGPVDFADLMALAVHYGRQMEKIVVMEGSDESGYRVNGQEVKQVLEKMGARISFPVYLQLVKGEGYPTGFNPAVMAHFLTMTVQINVEQRGASGDFDCRMGKSGSDYLLAQLARMLAYCHVVSETIRKKPGILLEELDQECRPLANKEANLFCAVFIAKTKELELPVITPVAKKSY